ncbi:hypothetical protein DL771_011701 [Monosporascus sp. 5C6A]|nr:hypothetical protein DL771_011701 [Monosporascus sp. 5C6A]
MPEDQRGEPPGPQQRRRPPSTAVRPTSRKLTRSHPRGTPTPSPGGGRIRAWEGRRRPGRLRTPSPPSSEEETGSSPPGEGGSALVRRSRVGYS